MSSSTNIDNRKKDILILGKGPTQRLDIQKKKKKRIQLISLGIIKNLFELAL